MKSVLVESLLGVYNFELEVIPRTRSAQSLISWWSFISPFYRWNSPEVPSWEGPWGSDLDPAYLCFFSSWRHGFDPWVGKISLEKEMATHSRILAGRIPRTEEPSGATVHGVTKSQTWLRNEINITTNTTRAFQPWHFWCSGLDPFLLSGVWGASFPVYCRVSSSNSSNVTPSPMCDNRKCLVLSRAPWHKIALSRALQTEMATDSSVLAWRVPGTGEPGWLLSMGLHRAHDSMGFCLWGCTETRLKQLSSSSSRWTVRHFCFERILAWKAVLYSSFWRCLGGPWPGQPGWGRLFFSSVLALKIGFIYIVKLKQILASSAFFVAGKKEMGAGTPESWVLWALGGGCSLRNSLFSGLESRLKGPWLPRSGIVGISSAYVVS